MLLCTTGRCRKYLFIYSIGHVASRIHHIQVCACAAERARWLFPTLLLEAVRRAQHAQLPVSFVSFTCSATLWRLGHPLAQST